MARSLNAEFDALPDLHAEFDALPEAPAEPAITTGGGVPLGAGTTGAINYGNWTGFNLTSPAAAALMALGDVRADKTGQATFGDSYRRNLGFIDQSLEAGEEAHPLAKWLGRGLGVGTGAAVSALTGPAMAAVRGAPAATAAAKPTLMQLAKEGAKFGVPSGVVAGAGASRGRTLWDVLADAGLGGVFGGALGATVPVTMAKAAPYVGGKFQDLAGWLKVNSLHPVPLLGESMEGIPGGISGVGRELLKRWIGGLSKSGTASQIDAAFEGAASKAGRLARAYDESGAAPVDLADALSAAKTTVDQLLDEPASKEAGQKLQSIVSDYAEKYGTGEAAPATAQEALATKRALGEVGYGAGREFDVTKNPVAGRYGAGVRQMERGVDSALDNALGPEFEQANTVIRRLGGARQAAERAAARTAGNTLLGLVPKVMGLGAMVGGNLSGQATPKAAAYALAAFLLGKYGAQAGARTLYGLGAGLNALPALASPFARAAPSVFAATRSAPALGLSALQLAGSPPEDADAQQTLADLLRNNARGGR